MKKVFLMPLNNRFTSDELTEIHEKVSGHGSDLIERLTVKLMELAFENRHGLHPRRLREIAEQESTNFMAFLLEPDESALLKHGESHSREGLGEKSVLAIGDVLRRFCWDYLKENGHDLLYKSVEVCAVYSCSVLMGFMEENRTRILQQQEQLRQALTAALESQRHELFIKEYSINTSINGIVLTNLDGLITYVNPAFIALWGREAPEDLLGKNIENFWQDEKILEGIEAVKKGRRKGYRGELVIEPSEGVVCEIELTASLIEDTKSNQIGIMASIIDITERKQAERDLRRLEEHLFQSQKMEAVGTLASGIAHDFNNILQAISGYIHLVLQKVNLDPGSLNHLVEADLAVERASDLVQRLLTFSRKVKPELQPVNLNLEVIRAVKILDRTIPKMVRIETDLSRDRIIVDGDANQLEQIIMNMGANSRDAMPRGGRLTISTRIESLGEDFCQAHPDLHPGEYALLCVSDTGEGIDENALQHIFEPFYTTKVMGKGTGLGLSTVYGIVKAHKGHITCESITGKGAMFRIYLPLSAESTAALTRGGTVNGADVEGGQETLLLVDDEHSVLEIADEVLKKHGYKTFLADSGERALEIYEEKGREIDLVIMDLGMPGIGGHACLRRILTIDPMAQVIIASGYSADEQIKTCLESGAAGFISKPYRLNSLLREVRITCDRKNNNDGAGHSDNVLL